MANTKDTQKMPEGDKHQCEGRKKTCSNCGYRYEKGDKSWYCPNCNESRRCNNKALEDRNVCRMHGGAGGRPPSTMYVIANKFQKAFNRIRQHPDLFEFIDLQAVLGTRFQEIQDQFNDLEDRGGVPVIELVNGLAAIRELAAGMPDGKGIPIIKIASNLEAMMEDDYRSEVLWNRQMQVTEQMRRTADSAKRWMRDNDQMLSVAELIEFLAWNQQVAFRFIPDPNARQAYINTLREALPSNSDIVEAEYVEVE